MTKLTTLFCKSNLLRAVAFLFAFSAAINADAQVWNAGDQAFATWDTDTNWSPVTVPNGRGVSVEFGDDLNIGNLQNGGNAFTYLSVGNNSSIIVNATTMMGNPIILSPEDPFNPGFPSLMDPATITVGDSSFLRLTFLNTATFPTGPDPVLLSVSVGSNSTTFIDGLGNLASTAITKSGVGLFGMTGGAASIDVAEGTLETYYSTMFASTVAGSISVQSGATLRGSGAEGLSSSGTDILIAEGGIFRPGTDPASGARRYDAPEASFSLAGTFEWSIGSLLDDDDGGAGSVWSLLDLTTGSMSIDDTTAKLTLSFGALDNPDTANPFWLEDHTWQVVLADSITGALAVENAVFTNGTFSFDSSTGQLLYQAVPEPSSVLLVLASGALYMFRRKRTA